jgi:hypothetical protein
MRKINWGLSPSPLPPFVSVKNQKGARATEPNLFAAYLCAVFVNRLFLLALPSLLCFNIDRLHRKALQCEVETLQGVIETLRKEVQSNDTEISHLRDQVRVVRLWVLRHEEDSSTFLQKLFIVLMMGDGNVGGLPSVGWAK